MFDFATAAYQGFKLLLLDLTGLSRDALHIHMGLAILLAVRLVWRGRFAWVAAWLAVLTFALAGEVFDWRSEGLRGVTVPWGAHWHDIWNTMLWPTLLSLIGWRLDRRSAPAVSGKDAEQSLEQA
jgi:hypothetical protein